MTDPWLEALFCWVRSLFRGLRNTTIKRETILGLAAEAHRRGNPLVQFNDEADHTITLVQLRVSEWLEQEARKIK